MKGNTMKKDNKSVLMMTLLVCSIFVLFSKLFTPTTMNFIIQGESTYIEDIPDIYTLMDCIIISIASFTLGISAFYLLLPGEESTKIPVELLKGTSQRVRQEEFLKILKGKEKKVVKELLKTGKMNQAELSACTNIPKSTLSRVLSDLESRGLVIRYEYGMSKMVKLSDEFR